MSIMMTFEHTLSISDNIDGMSLKDKLIADGIIVLNCKGKYELSSSRLGIPCFLCNDYKDGFAREDGNAISLCFYNPEDVNDVDVNDVFDINRDGADVISRLYPKVTFNSHASYCWSGCRRETAFDRYVTNGKDTDALGRPCVDSVSLPACWIVGKDPDNESNTLIKVFSGAVYSVNSQDIDAFENAELDWTKFYIRDKSDSSVELRRNIAIEVGRYESFLEEAEYLDVLEMGRGM